MPWNQKKTNKQARAQKRKKVRKNTCLSPSSKKRPALAFPPPAPHLCPMDEDLENPLHGKTLTEAMQPRGMCTCIETIIKTKTPHPPFICTTRAQSSLFKTNKTLKKIKSNISLSHAPLFSHRENGFINSHFCYLTVAVASIYNVRAALVGGELLRFP